LENSSPESAAEIIGRVLSASAQKGVDAVAFGTAPADDVQPPGLLNGVTPLAATASGSPLEMIAADLGALAKAMAAGGVDPDGMILVAAPAQAITLRLLSGAKFTNPIISTTALPDGTVAGFALDAVAAAFEGAPEIETSKEVALHFEATNPEPIVDGAPANPVFSTYQSDVIAIRCRARATWGVVAPGGAQVVAGVNW
jgi:hypothetical protein